MVQLALIKGNVFHLALFASAYIHKEYYGRKYHYGPCQNDVYNLHKG